MLRPEDNEMLCRVGPGTPMGELFRRFWLPALMPSELPEPDCEPVRLRLLGEGSLAAPLAAQARTERWLEVSPTVPHAEVAPFLQGLDLFCLPARVLPDHEEHDAHALMEAMACGIDCIGARSGIIPELLDDGTGLVVPPSEPSALAEAIADLADDRPRRIALGQAARRAGVAEFSLDAVARRRMEIYRHVLEA